MFFDVTSTFDIHVEHHVLTSIALLFHLRFKCTVEAVGIYLFIFQEFVSLNSFFEFLRSEEEIFHSVLLRSSWSAACAGNAESHVKLFMILHKPVYYCALSRSRRGGEYYQFAFHPLLFILKRFRYSF